MHESEALTRQPAAKRGRSGQGKLPSWRWEALRTTFWLVPTILVRRRRSAVRGDLRDRSGRPITGTSTLPFWIRAGSADAGRQVLIAIAAAVITVVGVVFSITILALTLASQQFGPRMMRNFVRDVGNQVTLGVFVATFVYSVLALVSITSVPDRPDFVPHLSITVAEALLLVDLAVLIYFIHHIAKSIQLPEVIAGIARDLMRAIDAEFPEQWAPTSTGGVLDAADGQVRAELLQLHRRARRCRPRRRQRLPAVRRLRPAGRHRVAHGRRHPSQPSARATSSWPGGPLATVWPRGGGRQVGAGPGQSARDRTAPDAHAGSRLRHRPARRDRYPGPVPGGQRHVHRPHLHRLALCRAEPVSGRTLVEGVYRDAFGRVRLIESDPSYARMVNRAFDKIRQAARGMPAVLIRLVDALTAIVEQTTPPNNAASWLARRR